MSKPEHSEQNIKKMMTLDDIIRRDWMVMIDGQAEYGYSDEQIVWLSEAICEDTDWAKYECEMPDGKIVADYDEVMQIVKKIIWEIYQKNLK